MRAKDIAGFQEAIRATHGADSLWVETVPVKEVFQGRTAWDGEVEVFQLSGHPKADRCYAWQYQDAAQWRYTTVLEIPPVDSPETAVKVAIAAKARSDDQLSSIVSVLQRAGFYPVVRGENMDRFVYVENADRSAEVGWNGVAFVVELFAQPSEISVRDYSQDTPNIAAEQAIDWLLRRGDFT